MTRQMPIKSLRLPIIAVVLMLSGCSLVDRASHPIEPSGATEPAIAPPPEQPVAAEPVTAEPIDTIPVPDPIRVAILLSDDVPYYVAVAQQISQRGPQHDYLTINLNRNVALDAKMLEKVKAFDPEQIVAVGLNAAKAGQQFADTPMVFCQVFNFADHELLSPTTNGVKLLPPFSLQFELWKDLHPDLRVAGIIIGAGQESLVAEIQNAAAEHNVELLTRRVVSDSEALFVFKRLTPKIQGFLLLPDSRVLSPRVLRDIVAYGRKHGTQTVVFNPQLLQLGADISFTSKDSDIADTVLRIIDGTPEKRATRPSRMTALSTLRVAISPEVAEKLSARTAEKLAVYLDAD